MSSTIYVKPNFKKKRSGNSRPLFFLEGNTDDAALFFCGQDHLEIKLGRYGHDIYQVLNRK